MSSAGELLFDRTRIERRVQLLRTLARDLARTRQNLRDAIEKQTIGRPALGEAESELASQAALLSQTTAALLDEIEALRRTIGDLQRGLRGGDRIALELRVPESENAQTVSAVLRNIPRVDAVAPTGETADSMKFSVSAPRSHDVRADIFRLCVEKGWVALELHREETSLEDIFRELTTNANLPWPSKAAVFRFE